MISDYKQSWSVDSDYSKLISAAIVNDSLTIIVIWADMVDNDKSNQQQQKQQQQQQQWQQQQQQLVDLSSDCERLTDHLIVIWADIEFRAWLPPQQRQQQKTLIKPKQNHNASNNNNNNNNNSPPSHYNLSSDIDQKSQVHHDINNT